MHLGRYSEIRGNKKRPRPLTLLLTLPLPLTPLLTLPLPLTPLLTLPLPLLRGEALHHAREVLGLEGGLACSELGLGLGLGLRLGLGLGLG